MNSIMSTSSSLSTKTVLVTGGNKGIGKAICEKLLTDYSNVHVLLGSRDIGRGKETVEELKNSILNAQGRIDLIQIDTSSDTSVLKAAQRVSQMKNNKIFGIINNAGVMGDSLKETVNVNYFGPRRVNDAFVPLLARPGGRIVNIASAAGPMYITNAKPSDLKRKLADPMTIKGGIDELDKLAQDLCEDKNNQEERFPYYGLSKALLNAYTVLHAKEKKDLIINSCTPGFIATDMTKHMGATNAPSKGTIAPLYCLMSEDISKIPSGRYYGSDAVRSPLDVYRGPGDPPYEGP